MLALRFPNSSRSTLKRLVLAGRVTLNGRRVRKLTEGVRESDQLKVADRARPVESSDLLEPLERIFEDQDLLVVHKPPGLLTSTGPRETRPTALAIIQKYLAEHDRDARAGLIHRLDRDASGLLVFSKNELAYESLKTQFFRHTVQRIYLALVHGSPKPVKGRIESQLVEYADGTVHSTKATGRGQRAITEYEVLRVHRHVAEVRIRLETGRKHQIRAHLAQREWPILGDPIYGRKDSARRLMLAAVELQLDHPRTSERMTFRRPAPPELDELMT
ncbi:MAG: RluA family pseudouridine synthase [Gemmatimonadaceae bacterium]|nr:RluA family pseudouridine synthase [Gemmatimonadaceae bacterium]